MTAEEWVICPECKGNEGRHQQVFVVGIGWDFDWVECEDCEGSGGWVKLVPDQDVPVSDETEMV